MILVYKFDFVLIQNIKILLTDLPREGYYKPAGRYFQHTSVSLMCRVLATDGAVLPHTNSVKCHRILKRGQEKYPSYSRSKHDTKTAGKIRSVTLVRTLEFTLE